MIENNYKNEVEKAVSKFRKSVERINNSDNPYYHDEAVKDYEIQQLREDLETNIEEIESRFSQEIDAEIEQAERAAKYSYFTPSATDKALVADAVSDLVADVTLAYSDNDKLAAFEQFEQRIDSLEASGLSEVRRKLPEVLSAVGNDQTIVNKLKGLNLTLRELRTPEQERLIELQDLKANGVTFKYKTLTFTHPAFKDVPQNRYYRR